VLRGYPARLLRNAEALPRKRDSGIPENRQLRFKEWLQNQYSVELDAKHDTGARL